MLWFCIWFLIYCSILWNVCQFMDFLLKKNISALILWMRDTYNLCEKWVTHQNSNDLIHILFCFINMCFQLLQLLKLIWEKYLKTNCQKWMFHHFILMLLMFLYTMRGIFKKTTKGGEVGLISGGSLFANNRSFICGALLFLPSSRKFERGRFMNKTYKAILDPNQTTIQW